MRSSPSDPDRAAKKHARSPLARRWWLNLAMLAVVVALAVFAWQRNTTPPIDTRAPLTNVDPASIRRIEIERPRQAAIALERSDADWRVTAPVRARADRFAVESLLRLLRAPIDSAVTPTDADTARYGLDRPTLIVRLDDNEIRFGTRHPLKDEHYVQYGSAVQLIAGRYYTQVATSYNHLIDSRLIEPGRKPVSLKLPGFTLALKEGTWQRQPEVQALSSDRINAFVDEWRHARALQVEKYSGRSAPERVVVEIEESDGRRTTLLIGVLARAPELILTRPDEGLEYRFPAESAQRLFNLTADEPK